MKNFNKIIESKVRVRFPDCDPFNHLNNSRYIDYIINAREDQLLEAYDFDLYQLAKEKGISWVVAQNQIAYLLPAMLMETVTIESKLLSFDDKSLVVEALMWDEQKTSLKAILWTKLVHYDLKINRSTIHSDELKSFFNEIVNPLTEMVPFEKRVEDLKLTSRITSNKN
ncbi:MULTISPECIES: acyl-CoA thioesterase [unclassified Flavobacterium]|uniref:acyl-CoA thioesterase n=1 Tax=unclassified Flavobacterium TaxID=196869 RepID=UPI00360DD64D